MKEVIPKLDVARRDAGGEYLRRVTFEGATLDRAELRGAAVDQDRLAAAESGERVILPDGAIKGVALEAGERLIIRDSCGEDDIPMHITFGSAVTFSPGGFTADGVRIRNLGLNVPSTHDGFFLAALSIA